MKTYEQMIQWHVNQVESARIRYHEWPSYEAIAEVYGVSVDQVVADINQEKEHREDQRRKDRRAEHRASNEARWHANLARRHANLEKRARAVEQSWCDNPDRMGGQFTDEEINSAGEWR